MSNSGRLRSWIGNVPWGTVRGVGDSGIWAMVILRSDSPEDEDGFGIVGHPIKLNLRPMSSRKPTAELTHSHPRAQKSLTYCH